MTSMTRRSLFSLAAILTALLIVQPLMAAAQRNIVLMIGDDHGLELGCYGHPVIKTPSMDRLAASGTRFTYGFAAVSSCSPSRSVLYTGMYNHTNGQYGLAHAVHNFASFPSVVSMPALLRKAGYRTALIGKHHVRPEENYPFDMLPCPGGPRNVIAMAETARKFFGNIGETPFLLVMGYTDPHRDATDFANKGTYRGVKEVHYDPADIIVPPFLADAIETRQDLAQYCQSVSRLDQGIGAMLDAIEQTGHADDTLVIYVSDNGIPFPGAKTTLYDPGVNLPCLIRSPAQKQRGVVNHAMISWVDIAPTILDWAGVALAKDTAGRSVLPILDETDPAGWDTIFGSHTFHEVTMYYPMRMIRTRKYKYILNLAHELEYPIAGDLWNGLTWQSSLRRGDTQFGCRTVDALLHHPKEELYDLDADPNETRNLAGDPAHADVLADLRTRLRAWQEKTKDPWVIKYQHE